jgi:hypothetical protein
MNQWLFFLSTPTVIEKKKKRVKKALDFLLPMPLLYNYLLGTRQSGLLARSRRHGPATGVKMVAEKASDGSLGYFAFSRRSVTCRPARGLQMCCFCKRRAETCET